MKNHSATHESVKPRRIRGGAIQLIRQTVATLSAMVALGAFAQSDASGCGPLGNSFGPFDYRVEKGNQLYLVESAHFTPQVEALIKGNAGYLGSDLDYTLRAFPNHPRALLSMMRYGEKTKSPHPADTRYSVECYFTRAIRFQPDDTTVRMLYATFLHRSKRDQAANDQLERAAALAKDNAYTHYNIGLTYLSGKNYDGALRAAHRAYALGFPRTELKDQLLAAGKWREHEANAPASTASVPRPPDAAQ